LPDTVTAEELEQLSKSYQCVTCHSVTDVRNGPSFKSITERYRERPRSVTVEVLAATILYGGAGNWGTYPMIAQDHWLNADEARSLARAILSLKTPQ
jgi:cytochrome c